MSRSRNYFGSPPSAVINDIAIENYLSSMGGDEATSSASNNIYIGSFLRELLENLFCFVPHSEKRASKHRTINFSLFIILQTVTSVRKAKTMVTSTRNQQTKSHSCETSNYPDILPDLSNLIKYSFSPHLRELRNYSRPVASKVRCEYRGGREL